MKDEIKLVITSATMNEKVFEQFFNTSAIYVKGRPYPGGIRYLPNEALENQMETSHLAHLCQTIVNIAQEMDKEEFEYKGHILVFTSGVQDIENSIAILENETNIDKSRFWIMPLHGLLAAKEQKRVFEETNKIKIILATRIAETAITIPNVRVVIDIGFDKETIYDPSKKMNITTNRLISQSSAT